MDFTEDCAAFYRFPFELPTKLLSANNLEYGVDPVVREDIHQVHTARIRYIDRRDPAKE